MRAAIPPGTYDGNRNFLDQFLEALMDDGRSTHVKPGSWARVPAGPLTAYVAFSDFGIRLVRSAESVNDSGEQFVRLYRHRFGEPLKRAEQAPGYLFEALQTGRLSDLEFDLRGVGNFDREVLRVTAQIPRGQTRSYSWVAREIGRPRAVRAVGTALGRNPVPVLIPCHRVTRSDGSAGGYAFGTAAKESLLRAEQSPA